VRYRVHRPDRPPDAESIDAAARGLAWGCGIVLALGTGIALLAWLVLPRG